MKSARFAFFSARVDPFIKAFLISDSLLYSSLNIVTVFFAVYASTKVTGGSLAIATWSLSAGYASRVVAELLFARRISKQSERAKVALVIIGMVLISGAYLGLATAHTVSWLYIWWIIGGLGWGLALPTKLAVVSRRINHEQSNQEWGLNDAMNMGVVAITTALCGAIVAILGIRLLLGLAAAINSVGVIPYIVFLYRRPKVQRFTPAIEAISNDL